MASNIQSAQQWGLDVNPEDKWSGLYYLSVSELHYMNNPEIELIAIEVIRSRFTDLRSKLPMLDRLAKEQGLAEIVEVNDAATLLFKHSVYKSYPISFVEKGQFDRLTKWLAGLTTDDLSGLDYAGVDGIDDWLDLLDRETSLRVVHSSGTSGKLSFLPRGRTETDLMIQGWRLNHETAFASLGQDAPGLEDVPIIYPGYRRSAMSPQRMMNRFVETVFGGDESKYVAMNPGRMSADALALGGRLQLASQKGELGQIQISPKLMARRDELIRSMTESSTQLLNFIEVVAKSHGGKSVAMWAILSQLVEIAQIARSKGLTHVFSPHSNIMFGGGWKGAAPSDDWETTVADFLGVDHPRMGYGMTELIAGLRSCEHGHYHLLPFQIPFILDAKTGAPFAREGVQAGRFGVFDLGASTYWGGFLTGDKVTLSYDQCACGRTTPALQKDSIRRYTEEEGGDDKITCADAPEAHENALAYLLASTEI